MIEVIFVIRNNNIISIESNGHAEYSEHGNDIVCAAVSILLQNSINSIEKFVGYEPNVIIRDGYLKAEFNQEIDNESIKYQNILLQSALLGLIGIQDEYKNYIKVIKREEDND